MRTGERLHPKLRLNLMRSHALNPSQLTSFSNTLRHKKYQNKTLFRAYLLEPAGPRLKLKDLGHEPSMHFRCCPQKLT